MFTKLQRTKVFRDPLYGYISVDYKIISDLIDSREVQTLETTFLLFHPAGRLNHVWNVESCQGTLYPEN